MFGIEPTSTALAMAIVELCSSSYSDAQFEPTKLGGILCFIIDRKLKSRFLRLFDINSSQLLFQLELCVNFARNYCRLRDKFYCFPLSKTILGINFAYKDDADCFRNLVQNFCYSGESPKEVAKEEMKK